MLLRTNWTARFPELC